VLVNAPQLLLAIRDLYSKLEAALDAMLHQRQAATV
jgi:hypothetical protein